MMVSTIMFAVALVSQVPEPVAKEDQPIKVGAVGTLEFDSWQGTVWVAKSMPDYHEMLAAEVTYYDRRPNRPPGGGAAMYHLATANRVKVYAIGTKIQVLKDGGRPLFVQVLSGEEMGERGWIQREKFKVSPPVQPKAKPKKKRYTDQSVNRYLLNMQMQKMMSGYRPPRAMNHVDASSTVSGRR